jgi:hypothetical protein
LPDESASFKEKQMYMYSVFQRALQTDKGKAIVQSHEATHDAQKVYKELYDFCSKSTRAVFDSSTMQSYTSSIRVGDGPWSASAQSDCQSGTASIAKLAQTRQIYDNQFDCVADEYNRDIPVTVIHANKDMRHDAMMPRFTWSNVSEADRSLWDRPSTLGTSPKCVVSLPDVMIDDPDHG